MAYKSIRFVGFAAGISGLAAVLGTVATNAASILESQADEIAELRRQVAEQRSAT